jgi:hypothetical protein
MKMERQTGPIPPGSGTDLKERTRNSMVATFWTAARRMEPRLIEDEGAGEAPRRFGHQPLSANSDGPLDVAEILLEHMDRDLQPMSQVVEFVLLGLEQGDDLLAAGFLTTHQGDSSPSGVDAGRLSRQDDVPLVKGVPGATIDPHPRPKL